MFRAVVLAESDEVGLAEVPQIAAHFADAGPAHAETTDAPTAAPAEDYEPVLISNAFADEQPFAPALGPPIAPGDTLALLDTTGEVRPLDEIEAEIIRYAITHYRGQMSEVARRLQIGRSTLYRKLEALGMSTERAEAGSETGA